MKRLLWSALLGGVVGGAAVWLVQKGSFSLRPGGMTYEQLAALLLGFASLVVTTLGIGVAILALWGYSQFKTMVGESAQKAAIAKVDEELKDGELRNHTELVVTTFLEKGMRDGSLAALIEGRREEGDRLREVDERWAEATEADKDGK